MLRQNWRCKYLLEEMLAKGWGAREQEEAGRHYKSREGRREYCVDRTLASVQLWESLSQASHEGAPKKRLLLRTMARF